MCVCVRRDLRVWVPQVGERPPAIWHGNQEITHIPSVAAFGHATIYRLAQKRLSPASLSPSLSPSLSSLPPPRPPPTASYGRVKQRPLNSIEKIARVSLFSCWYWKCKCRYFSQAWNDSWVVSNPLLTQPVDVHPKRITERLSGLNHLLWDLKTWSNDGIKGDRFETNEPMDLA